MSTIVVGVFQQFDLTDEEQKQARVLPPLTQMLVHNMRCMIAHTQLNIKIDMANPLESAQQHAYLAGKLDVLNELLTPVPVSTPLED